MFVGHICLSDITKRVISTNIPSNYSDINESLIDEFILYWFDKSNKKCFTTELYQQFRYEFRAIMLNNHEFTHFFDDINDISTLDLSKFESYIKFKSLMI